MQMICLDLEGVLVPEVWQAVAAATGIEELRKTTRDIADYDALMCHRIAMMDAHGIDFPKLRNVVQTLEPFPGARSFLDRLREHCQVTMPLGHVLRARRSAVRRPRPARPVFCHHLETSADLRVIGWEETAG